MQAGSLILFSVEYFATFSKKIFNKSEVNTILTGKYMYRHPWIILIIRDALEKKCPTLDLNGEDSCVLDLCVEDYYSYLKFLHSNFQEIEPFFFSNLDPFIDPQKIAQIHEFTILFVNLWWKKYLERVKIVFKQPPNTIRKRVPTTLSPKEKEELLSLIISTLIKEGEICGTKIIANTLLAKHTSQKNMTQKRKAELILELIKEAKKLSRLHGPLLFLKPKKGKTFKPIKRNI